MLTNVPRSDLLKLLGLMPDNKLLWEDHIRSVCVILNRVIFSLRRLVYEVPEPVLKQAYFASFHSILVYGIRIRGLSVHRVLVLQ